MSQRNKSQKVTQLTPIMVISTSLMKMKTRTSSNPEATSLQKMRFLRVPPAMEMMRFRKLEILFLLNWLDRQSPDLSVLLQRIVPTLEDSPNPIAGKAW